VRIARHTQTVRLLVWRLVLQRHFLHLVVEGGEKAGPGTVVGPAAVLGVYRGQGAVDRW